MTNGIPIGDLVTRSHALSVEKGWYETWPDGTTKAHNVNVPEKLALIHSEVSEALEAYRVDDIRRRCGVCNGERMKAIGAELTTCDSCHGTGFLEIYPGEHGKPEGLAVELADVVIRVADLCGALGLDLAEAIERKHAYNTTRAYRHGGKKC